MKYVAFDQFGSHFFIKRHPRKELLEYFGRKHADRMYIGEGKHIGYIIAGHWLDVLRLSPAFEVTI